MEKIAAILAAVKKVLMDSRFIRVDGLRCKPICGGEEVIIARNKECLEDGDIRHAGNSGMMAVALSDGSVWVRSQHDGKCYLVLDEIQKAAGTIPVKRGCNVPLSNQEEVSYHELLRRLVDPDWIPDYHLTEEAREAGFSLN